MPTDKEKKQIAVAGGAAAVAAPFTPTRVRMPASEGSRKAASDAASGRKASVSDLRSAYRGMGARMGNDSHTAKLAQNIKEKGFREDSPVELKRFRSGESMVVGGHHRVRAAEMIGLKEVPTKVTESRAKHPYSVVPLYARGKYKRDVWAARKPEGQLNDAQLKRLADKKTGRTVRSVNSVKSRVEESITAMKKPRVGIPVAAGSAAIGGGLAYKNKDKITKKDATDAQLARAKRQQANLSTTSAALGATALGTKGAEYAIRSSVKRNPHASKNTVRLARAHKLDRASLGILTTAAGVGSISGLRFAHVQREEAKKIEKGLVMTNAFGISHEYVLIEKGKHSPPNEPSTLQNATDKGKVTLKRVGAATKTFSGKHPYMTSAAVGGAIGGAILAPGILASESASRRRVKRAFGKARGFDPEERRERRQKVYATALVGGAGAAGASAVTPAKKAAKQIKRDYKKGGAEKVLRLKTLKSKPVQQTLKRGGAAGAAIIGTGVIASQARNSGKRYNGWYS